MGKVYAFLLGVAAGFGLYHMALSYHVIRANDGLHLTPKVSQTLSNTYIDIRGMSLAEQAEHPAVLAAIAQSGDEALQQELLGGTIEGVAEQAEGLLQQP